MEYLFSLVTEYFFLYVWTIGSTFVNIIAPTSGSMVINPVTALFVGLQRAIGIGAFIFFLTGIHRVFLFRKDILSDNKNIEVLKLLIPLSALGAFFGGVLVSSLNVRLLAGIIVVTSIYFIAQILRKIYTGQAEGNGVYTKTGMISVGTLSGFLQGGGLPGADMRNNYLRTVLQEVSVRAVGSVAGLVAFFVSGMVILFNNHLSSRDLIFIITVTPFLIISQTYGKKVLDALEDKKAKLLSVAFSIIGISLLASKYLL